MPSSSSMTTTHTSEEMLTQLRRHFGHRQFREGQEQIVGAVLNGRDVLAVMPTGSGKSLGFQLPAVLLPGTTIVVSPLIALMKNHYRIAIARGDPMIAADPSYVYYRLTVATALTRLADALQVGGCGAEAAPLVSRGVELIESASAKDPADARLRFELAMAYAAMGDIAPKDANA